MIFWKLFSASMRSQMQYPASFLMLICGHLLATSVDILGLWVLLNRFQAIGGWGFYEVALLYGTAQVGFAVAETFGQGFEHLSQWIKRGEFDRFLLRPLHPFIFLATCDVQLMRIGRLLQGGGVLLWSACHLRVAPHLILLTIAGTAILFYSLFVIQGALSFWTIDTLEVMNVATYGGLQAGQYPMTIYSKPMRFLFTLFIPLACVHYLPVATALQHERAFWGLPLVGLLFFYCASQLWRRGVRRYCATGS